MIKKIFSTLTVPIIFLSLTAPCFASISNSIGFSSLFTASAVMLSSQDSQISSGIALTFDGERIDTTVVPVVVNGVAFVSATDLRAISDSVISWSDRRKELAITHRQATVILKIGSKTALVNNKIETMPVAPFISGGNAMLPVKYINAVFGYEVVWKNDTKEIAVTSPKEMPSTTDPAICILSYDDAIKTGIKKSPDYQSSILSKDRVQSQDDDLYLSPGTYNLQMLKIKQDLKIYNNWADKQIAIVMEQVGNSIKNQMDDLSLLFCEKKNQQDQVDLLSEKLRIETIKHEFGMTSFQSLLSMQTEHQKQVQNLILIDQKVNAAYIKLNQALGNPADYRNALEYDVKYEPIGNVKLDYKIIDDTASDPFIWYASQNVDSKEFKLNLYEYNVGEQSWTLTALDLTEARKNLNDTKTALAGEIRNRYQNLLQIEDQIKLLELNLEQARDSVNAVRLQYDLGNAIGLEVEEAQMAIPSLEYQIQSLMQQHTQLKMLFEKPYLAPTYVSGS